MTTDSRSTAPRASRARRAVAAFAALLLAVLAGCTSEARITVNSNPSGARILIDGVDSGRQTPSSITLSTEREHYEIKVEKAGYNEVGRTVVLGTDVDVIDADDAACTVCVSPCCCFLPLIRLLDPVDVHTRFRPSQLDFELEVAGQGARLELDPRECEVYVDGRLAALLEGNYLVTTVGEHELEVRAAGFRAWSRSIRVDERVYQRLKVALEVEGQGLLVAGTPEGAKVYVDEQFQGTLSDEVRRVRTEPGPHLLRVEAEGYVAFQDVVQVATDRYHELEIALALDGQGLFVRKPEGLPAKTPEVQLYVDGALQGSAFDTPIRTSAGKHVIEIRVGGRETRRLEIELAPGQWIDVQPGPKSDPKAARSQATLWGLCVHAPEGIGELAPQDVRIRVNGVLIGQEFGTLFETSSDLPVEVEVVVKGYKPWKDRVVVTRRGVTDVYPSLEKE